jgi:hypothetical protein
MTPRLAEALERVLTVSAKNVDSQSGRKNQENRILWLLSAAWPAWTPAPELSKISLQYGARIFSLRRRRGFLIANRVRIVDGVKHGEFRLGSRPIPSSEVLRKSAGPRANPADPVSGKDTFPEFGNVKPESRYTD